MDKCKPLPGAPSMTKAPMWMSTVAANETAAPGTHGHVNVPEPVTRGLHSSTFLLNLGAFRRKGGAHRCSIGGDREYLGVCRVHFVLETAQVELKSGRVYAPARDAHRWGVLVSLRERHVRKQRHILQLRRCRGPL